MFNITTYESKSLTDTYKPSRFHLLPIPRTAWPKHHHFQNSLNAYLSWPSTQNRHLRRLAVWHIHYNSWRFCTAVWHVCSLEQHRILDLASTFHPVKVWIPGYHTSPVFTFPCPEWPPRNGTCETENILYQFFAFSWKKMVETHQAWVIHFEKFGLNCAYSGIWFWLLIPMTDQLDLFILNIHDIL